MVVTAEALATRPDLPDRQQARNWRQDQLVARRRGVAVEPTARTVREAADELLAGMEVGTILDRSGKPYKPSTCRSYRQALYSYILPELGDLRLSSVTRRKVQDLVDNLWQRASRRARSTTSSTRSA